MFRGVIASSIVSSANRSRTFRVSPLSISYYATNMLTSQLTSNHFNNNSVAISQTFARQDFDTGLPASASLDIYDRQNHHDRLRIGHF
jgi:hypothetical protein